MAEKTPNGFIENKGQWPEEVEFLFQSNGINAWITDFGVVYDFQKLTYPNAQTKNGSIMERTVENPKRVVNLEGHVVKMELENGTLGAAIERKNASSHNLNYFIGNDQSKWATDVKTYAEAIIKDVYQGIDIRYYTDRGMLRYDFIVHPGADPSVITWNVDGVNTHVSENGQLVFETVLGDVKQAELLAYQTLEGKKNTIASSFTLRENKVSFQLGEFNSNEILIIDPVLYATYVGGAGDGFEEYSRIVVNSAGEKIMLGESPASAFFPTTVGSYSTSNAGSSDIVVSKINTIGDALVYSTFIGGSGLDLTIDGTTSQLASDGGLVVTGTTESTDFPTVVGAYDNSFNGERDAFVFKLNVNGNSLQYSTFLGGSTRDFGLALALDAGNNIYLAGTTFTGDFPITGGAYDQTENGFGDIFVAKFNSTASSLEFSTLIGGDSIDIAYTIALDAQNNIILGGHTNSTDFPTTSGAYNQTLNGDRDLIVCKLNSTGSTLLNSSYFGGSGFEECWGMDTDATGNVYLTGYTKSTDLPTVNALQPTYGGGDRDAYLVQFNPTFSTVINATYFGGDGWDNGRALLVDANGTPYICGYTSSANFDLTVQVTAGGGAGDAFLTRFRPDMSGILYSTLYGGSGISGVGTYVDEETFSGIWVNNSGTAYVAGYAIDNSFPVTSINVQATGFAVADPVSSEAIVAGFNTCDENFSFGSSNSPVCENSNVNLTADGGTTYSWSGPNGYTSSQQNPTFLATAQSAGIYTVTVTYFGCTSTSQVTLVVDPALNTSIIGPGNVDPLTPTNFVVSQNLGSTYTWSITNGTLISGQGTNSTSITFPIEGTATVMVTEVNGNCSETTSITVNVGCTSAPNPPAITGSATADENTTGAYSVPAQSGYSYTWTVTGGNIISGQGTNAISVQWGAAGAGSVSIIWADGNGCESNPASTSVTITGIVTPPPAQWITIATDPAGDGADPNAILMDGTLLEYKYIESNDSLYFRATVAAMSALNTQAAGLNVHLYYNGGGTTYDFFGDDNNATTNTLGWHRMLTTWVTGTPPTNYSGTIGICDAAGFTSNNFTNVAQNNINIWIDQAARTITIGLLRADAIPNSAISSPVTVAAAVGSNEFWNDDIYLPGATINVGPQGIFNAPETEQLSIYPNPSNGLFGLDLKDTEFTNSAEIIVFDNTGRKVYQSMVQNNKMQIDLSNVSTGIYMLQVREGNLLGSSRIAVVK